MQIFDTEALCSAPPFGALIEALRELFVQGCELPLRHTHALSAPDGSSGTLLIMPAWVPRQSLGITTVRVTAGNAARGLPGLFST